MAKIVSREVHVTVTYTVTVSAEEASTDRAAIEVAKERFSIPRAWDTRATVFEREEAEEARVKKGRGSY